MAIRFDHFRCFLARFYYPGPGQEMRNQTLVPGPLRSSLALYQHHRMADTNWMNQTAQTKHLPSSRSQTHSHKSLAGRLIHWATKGHSYHVIFYHILLR